MTTFENGLCPHCGCTWPCPDSKIGRSIAKKDPSWLCRPDKLGHMYLKSVDGCVRCGEKEKDGI